MWEDGSGEKSEDLTFKDGKKGRKRETSRDIQQFDRKRELLLAHL